MEQQQNWGAGLHNYRQVMPQIEELPFQAREAINVLRGNIQLSGYDLKVIAITRAWQPWAKERFIWTVIFVIQKL